MVGYLQTMYDTFITLSKGANELFTLLFIPLGELVDTTVGDGTFFGWIADGVDFVLRLLGVNLYDYSLAGIVCFGAVSFLVLYLILKLLFALPTPQ